MLDKRLGGSPVQNGWSRGNRRVYKGRGNWDAVLDKCGLMKEHGNGWTR
jgi:hypothetical protein